MKSNHNYSNRFRILKGGKISLVVSALLGSVTLSFAAPSGGVVTSGSATISQSGNTTNINQSTSKATINWNKFNIASHETVNFNQPNVNSITLNRVIGNERSIIDGALNANGQVWILNSNGVLFGKNASINTAGLLATTKNISDTNFQKGNYSFSGNSTESVINQGTIKVKNNGYVIFASNEAKNSGTIEAIKGRVQLTGADEYTINLNGNSLIDLSVDKGTLDALVENSGTILADGGEVYLTTHAVDELLRGVVNNTGIIEANSLDGINGHVELYAHGGTANIAGTIKAKGGFVETSGKELSVASTTLVEASKWLLDPVNMIIESTGGSDITGASVSATAIESNLATTDIELLADNDITVNEDITWGEATKLTLTAGNEIYVNAIIENTNNTYGGVYFNAVNRNAAIKFDATTGKVIINNINQLQWISQALNGRYELGSNIDASDTRNWNIGDHDEDVLTADTAMGFDPIARVGSRFQGTFDGKGYVIDGLYINRPNQDNIGLFGSSYLNTSRELNNIALTNIDITGRNNVGGISGESLYFVLTDLSVTGKIKGYGNNVGGIFGLSKSAGVIINSLTNSYAEVDVSGVDYVGGFIGNVQNNLSNNIQNSYSSGTVEGNSYVGGFIGGRKVDTGTLSIRDSYSTAKVDATGNYVGGFIGFVRTGIFSQVYARGNVTSSGDEIGGLIGTAEGSKINEAYAVGNVLGRDIIGGLIGHTYYSDIEYSYASGNVSGNNSIGGLTGMKVDFESNVIKNSYSTGDVLGKTQVGGFVGLNNGNISNSYSTGKVTGESEVGGFVGLSTSSKITNSYWDIDNSGMSNSEGSSLPVDITGIYSSTNTINAFNQSTYTGFNFTDDWIVYESHTRPLLRKLMTELTVKANDVTRTYDGTIFSPSSAGVSYSIPTYDSSLVNGTLNYTSSGDMKNAGTAAINVNGLYSNQQGYIISYDTGTLTTNKKELNANYIASDKIYDGTNSVIVSGTLSGVISGETVSFSNTSANFVDKNAGDNKTVNIFGITLNGADSGNYSISNSSSTTANISKKSISANYSANDKIYDGTTNAVVNGILDGIVSGDTVALSQNANFVDKNVGINKSIIGLSLEGIDSGNYTISSSNSATANISKKSITANYVASDKIYDGNTNAVVNGSLDGIISGDTVTFSNTTANFADKNAGTGKTVNIDGISLSGVDSSNYSISNTSSTTADITKRALTLEAKKEYDGTDDLTGFVNFGNLVGAETLEYTQAKANSSNPIANNFIKEITLQDGTNGGLVSNYELPSLFAYSANNSVQIGNIPIESTTTPDLSKVITPITNKTVLTNKDIDALLKSGIDIKTIIQQLDTNELALIPGIVMQVLNGGINLPFGSKQQFNLNQESEEEENTI